jgi:UDP-N-acetylglucosamine 2-epimerase (non-hydrolysing)
VKIATIVGARPNFVKAAALLHQLRERAEVRVRLIHTGQHYDSALSDLLFRDLGLPEPDVNLGVRGDSPAVHLAETMRALVSALTDDRPHIVVVMGDVNSTLAGALVAAKLGIALAHVEAGLRSFDRSMPEEVNRVLTDAISDYCFTTEPSANDNLAREGVPLGRVFHVGNVMIDTLFRLGERAAASPVVARFGLTRRAYAVLTLHRPANVDDPAALTAALAAVGPVARDVPVVFPVHPRTRGRLIALGPSCGAGVIRPVDPLPYLDFVGLMTSAACVLTDSGGVQEETTALGVPCLTLRSTTERPITVSDGTNEVVGVDPARVATAWRRIRRGEWPSGRLPELWDGKAAARIVAILLERL